MTIPADVLVRALDALKAAHERLLDQTAKDPYMLVIRSESELGYYVEQILKNTQTEVTQ